MKFPTILVFSVLCVIYESAGGDGCSNNAYQYSYNQFCVKSFKVAAKLNKRNFVISHHTTYLALAAIAEGAAGDVRKELFEVLELPEEACLRQKLYSFVVGLDKNQSNAYFNLTTSRLFVVSEDLKINENWAKEIKNNGFITSLTVPTRSNPDEARKLLQSNLLRIEDLTLDSDSVLMESLYFHNILDASSLSGRIEKDMPFYGVSGKQVATVDMIHMRKRALMVYVPSFKAKFLEFKIGKRDSYSLVVILNEDSNDIDDVIASLTVDIVMEAFRSIGDSSGVVDISIPLFKVKYNHNDKRKILEEIGINKLWNDRESLRTISDPGAKLSGFIQNILVDIDAQAPTDSKENLDIFNIASKFSKELSFNANRPFMYAIIDTKLRAIPFGGVYYGED